MGGGSKIDLSGPAAALAKSPKDDPDPNFFAYDDAAPGQYVVTLAQGTWSAPSDSTDGASTNAIAPSGGDSVTDVGAGIASDYGVTMVASHDYAGSFTCTADETTARLISHDGRVASVEANAFVYACGSISNPGYALDRIDQRTTVTASSTKKYSWTKDGSGVTVFVLDTGIYAGCADFAPGQVSLGWPTASEPYTGPTSPAQGFYGLPTSADDDSEHGHGTPVADAVGGQTRGVAHGVKLVSIKVLNSKGVGTIETVLAGMNDVLRDLGNPQRPNHPAGRAIINMSLGFHNQDNYVFGGSVRLAIDFAQGKNVITVVAAGNTNDDAGRTFPANVPEAITVGAIDGQDNLAYFGKTDAIASNSGSAVDVYAPGIYNNLFGFNRTNGSRIDVNANDWYGTSFAAPMVTGVVAQLIQKYPGLGVPDIQSWITNNATTPSNSSTGGMHFNADPRTVVAPGTNNRILYTNL